MSNIEIDNLPNPNDRWGPDPDTTVPDTPDTLTPEIEPDVGPRTPSPSAPPVVPDGPDQFETTRVPGMIPGFYPNTKGQMMSAPAYSHRGRTQLRKARIYSVRTSTETIGSVPQSDSPYENRSPVPIRSRLDTTLSKAFQYNPPELQVGLKYAPVDDVRTTAALAEGGEPSEVANRAQLGAANTGVTMFFDRTAETHNGKRIEAATPYMTLGVGKDILDIYGVISGEEAYFDTTTTLSDITHQMADLTVNGSEILQNSFVAVQYSRDFTIYGMVVSLGFRFTKWSYKLIPTQAFVDMQIDIHSLGNQSLVNSRFVDPLGNQIAAEEEDEDD